MEIIAITNNKGGVLKTTSVITIASLLYLEGKKVLIIDADNQGNAAVSFGVNPDEIQKTFYDLMMQKSSLKETVINVYGDKGGNRIDLIPSNDDTAMIDFEVLPKNQGENKFKILKNALEDVPGEYDAVIIDSPPNMGLMMGNVLTAATNVLVPFQPEPYSVRSLIKILQAIKDFKTLHNSKLDLIGVFPTLVDNRTNVHAGIIEDAAEFAKQSNFTLFDTHIPKSVREADSIAFNGLPLALVNDKEAVIMRYKELLKECRERMILV